MDCSLNIVHLIESNPIAKLTDSYNNRFLAKIKETFSETQQQLFVSSFFCYLNYNQSTDFVIDLDNVWQWLGFSQKDAAKRVLDKHFTVENDYKFLRHNLAKQTNKGRGGHNREQIMLNIKTFKMLCIKAATKKADEIHEYFIKLEEMLQQLVQEESDELKQQLQQTKNEKQQIEAKNIQLEEENKLLQKRGNAPVIYIYNIDTRALKPELKIGYTINLHSRIKPYKQVCKHGKVELTVEIYDQNVKTVENFIHHMLSKYQVKDEVFQLDVEEAKMMILRIVNTIKLFTLTNEGERQLKLSQLYERELEVVDNQIKERVSTCEMATQTDEIVEAFSSTSTANTNSNEKNQKFDQFITEHCIVRDDVEVSTTDIIGQYRIVTQTASKDVYHAFKAYLDTRFKSARLKQQNQKNVINGYVGVKLRDIDYSKSTIPSDVQNFIYHACVFSPSGKALFSDLVDEYKKWKIMVQKPQTENDPEELKSYLKNTNYVLYTTIWANNGGGQGYYGIVLKRDMDSVRTTSSTGKKVEKRMVDTNELLGTWDTIAKAAEAEAVCAAKMSRSIKNRVVFGGDYYFCIGV
jgi:phage anti-repressor protein